MNFAWNRKEIAAAAVVFLSALLVFRLSPIHQVADSKFQTVASEELLWHHTFSLDRRIFPTLRSRQIGETLVRGETLHYHLEQIGDRFYYYFPPGTAVLSMPFVALMNAVGISAVDASGTYSEEGETKSQANLAALLMAGLALFVFLTSRLLLPLGWSVLIALGTAFGTQIWSTVSRAMWTETWGVFILSFVLWLLLRAEIRQLRHRPILLATCLAWLYFVRPTFAVPIVAITVYLLLYHRAILVPYLLTGAVWLAAFIAYSQYHFGQFLPNYYQANRLSTANLWEGLLGNVMSPSRGQLIYAPVLLFVFYLLLRYRKHLALRRWVALSSAVIFLHLVAVSAFPQWWAGFCYGPRYMTSAVPWFALLAIFAVHAWLAARATTAGKRAAFRWRIECGVGALLLFCSIIFNGEAGFSYHSIWWNATPVSVDAKPDRVWDWKDPQLLRPLQPEKSFQPAP